MKQSIKISLDEELINAGKMIAAQHGISLDRLLNDEIKKIIKNAVQYDEAKRKAIAEIKFGFHSGLDRYPSRDELHG